MVFGRIPQTRTVYAAANIVAGGTRLFKSSRSDNESGTVYAYYNRNGSRVSPGQNLGDILKNYQDNYLNGQVYCAGSDAESAMGTAGFLMGTIYQPTKTDEVEDLIEGNRLQAAH